MLATSFLSQREILCFISLCYRYIYHPYSVLEEHICFVSRRAVVI